MLTIHEEISRAVDTIGRDFKTFRENNEQRWEEERKHRETLERKINAQRLGNQDPGAVEYGADEHKALSNGFRALISGNQAEAAKYFREASAETKGVQMQVGIDADGGYVVSPTFSREMTRIMLEICPFLQVTREVQIEGDSFEEIVDKATPGANWTGETDARGNTATPDVGLFTCPVHEIYANPRLTQKLIDTAKIDVVAWMNEKIAEQLAASEAQAFITGNGVAKPRGITNYPTAAQPDATRPWGTIEHINTGVAGDFPIAANFPSDKLVDVVSSLKAQYRSGAVWLMNRSTEAKIRKFKDGNGMYIWQPGLTAAGQAQLLGHQVVLSEEMPTLANGSLSVAFGNFKKGYTVVRRLGVRFLADPYTDRPFVKLYTYARVGGGVNNSEAIKFLRFGT
jgi:HK97 family phage major capsid protein